MYQTLMLCRTPGGLSGQPQAIAWILQQAASMSLQYPHIPPPNQRGGAG